ncbi:MAG: hypothetical protein ILA44_02050 [Prevotella sp.]|nr:hypothetical protein [Prevotella sp.]
MENITDVIEPSCGAGAFIMTAPCPISLAIDLEPELDELVDTTNNNNDKKMYGVEVKNTSLTPSKISLGHTKVAKHDFLTYPLTYQKGSLIVGNPPYGSRMNMALKFYNRATELGDYIAFILPISQLNNTSSMYRFMLLYSEDLGLRNYSGKLLHCCLNIYKRRDEGGYNRKPKPVKVSGVSIYRAGDPMFSAEADIIIRMRGAYTGQILSKSNHTKSAYHIKVDNPELKERVLNVLQSFDWSSVQATGAKSISKTTLNNIIHKGLSKC